MKKSILFSAGLFILVCAAPCARAQGIDAPAELLLTPYLNSAALKTGTNSLNKRLGDLRRTEETGVAVWGRGFYADYTRSGDIKLDAEFTGFEGGIDYAVLHNGADRVYVGLMGGYMDSGNVKFNGAPAAKVSAPSAGLYASWLNQKGWFADFTARNFFYTTENFGLPDSKTDWNVAAASLELGKEFKFGGGRNSFFKLEPKIKGVYGHFSGETIHFVKYSPMNAVLARAGLFAGYSKTLNNCAMVEPYIEAGYNRDLSPDAKMEDGGGNVAKLKLSGGSFDAGGGLNIIVNDIISLYSYAGYEKGNDIKNFMLNGGVRLAFAGARKGKRCCSKIALAQSEAPGAGSLSVPPIPPPAAAPAPLYFKRVVFDFDKYSLTPQDEKAVEDAAGLIKISGKRFEIQGYTDRIGTPQYNQALSDRRAKTVYDRLISLGVAPRQLEYKGYGFASPLNSGENKEANAENRRVEFILKD